MPQPVEFINISASPDGLDQATRRKARSDAMRAYRRKQRNALELKQREEERRGGVATRIVTSPRVPGASGILDSPPSGSSAQSRDGTLSPMDEGIGGLMLEVKKEGEEGEGGEEEEDRGGKGGLVDLRELRRRKLLAYAKKYGAAAVAAAVMSAIPKQPNDLGRVFCEGIDISTVGRWFAGMPTTRPGGIVSESVTDLVVRTLWNGAQHTAILMDACVPNAALVKAQITGQGLEDDFFLGKGRCIQNAQSEISKHGRNVDDAVIVVIITLAWLEILTGDTSTAIVHFQGVKQLASSIPISPELWLLVGWPVARISLLLGQDPVRVRCTSDTPPLSMCPHQALSREALEYAERLAHDNACILPYSRNESDELSQHEFCVLFRGLYRLHIVQKDSSLGGNPHILGGHQAAVEYDLARIRFRIFRALEPTSLHRAMEMVVSAAELHQALPSPQAPVALRLISRTTTLLALERDWISGWTDLVGDLSGLLWIIATITAFQADDASIEFNALVYGLLNRLGIQTFEAFLNKMHEWPWFVEEYSTNRSARVWAKVERGVAARRRPP